MRVWKALLLLFLLFWNLPGAAHARNTHGVPATEMQAWFGDALSPYLVSGCAPVVPASSLTFAAFACKGYVLASTQLVYVDQPAEALGPLNAGNGTYWLALHRDLWMAVGGWSRQAGTHYLWQLSATEPVTPTAAHLFGKVTVLGGVITAVELWGTRWIAQPMALSAATIYGVGARLIVLPTGTLDQGANALTINGRLFVFPEDRQVFLGSGTVNFGTRSVERINVMWFGALGDGSCTVYGSGTNNKTAVDRAITSVPSGFPVPAYFPHGCYDFATAPSMSKAGLALAGPPTGGNVTTGGTGQSPTLLYGGTGTFLLFNQNDMSIQHLNVVGNNVAGTKGIELTNAHHHALNVHVSKFGGAGSFCAHIHGTTPISNEADYARWQGVKLSACETGLLIDGSPTNANTFHHLLVFGNVNDGIRIDGGTDNNFFGALAEGNCTSAGTCADFNFMSGINVHWYGHIESLGETATRFAVRLATCTAGTADNLYLYGSTNSAALDTKSKLRNASENSCTYVMESQEFSTPNKIPFFSALLTKNIRIVTSGNIDFPALMWLREHLILGTQGAADSTSGLALRRIVSLANDATTDLSAQLMESAPLNGILWVQTETDNAFCEFAIVADAATELRDPSAGGPYCSPTLGTASSVNLEKSGGVLVLQNKRGGARTFALHFFSTK